MNIHTHFIYLYAVAKLSKNYTVHGNKLIYFSETKCTEIINQRNSREGILKKYITPVEQTKNTC